jgi:hypothetical protein
MEDDTTVFQLHHRHANGQRHGSGSMERPAVDDPDAVVYGLQDVEGRVGRHAFILE